MSSAVLHVIARITAKPNKLDETAAMLQGLVTATRKEAGCLRYDLLRNATDPADFSMVEQWRDAAALELHFKTPHMLAAFAQVPDLLAAPPDVRSFLQIA